MDKKEFKEPELKELDKSMDEYIHNPEFQEYVDGYCRCRKIEPEIAVTHVIVREVEADYKHKREQYR